MFDPVRVVELVPLYRNVHGLHPWLFRGLTPFGVGKIAFSVNEKTTVKPSNLSIALGET